MTTPPPEIGKLAETLAADVEAFNKGFAMNTEAFNKGFAMNYEILQGDCIESMRQLPGAIVQTCVTSPLLKIFAVDVFVAVYPNVTDATEGNEVVEIKAQSRISSPRLDVMGAKATCASVGRTATHAMVIISFVDCPDDLFPLTRRVQSLTFWRTAILEVGIGFARSIRHAVSFATQPGLFNAGFCAQHLARFVGVSLAQKWVDCARLRHVAIAIRKVISARARRDAIANKPGVNLLRIAVDELAYVVGAKPLDKIALAQPCFINRLLGFLPFAFAFHRAESSDLLPATPHLNTALLTR